MLDHAKPHYLGIPVEIVGAERQLIPATLVAIDKAVGYVKYSDQHRPFSLSLSELRLAPGAFEPPNLPPSDDDFLSSLDDINLPDGVNRLYLSEDHKENSSIQGNPTVHNAHKSQSNAPKDTGFIGHTNEEKPEENCASSDYKVRRQHHFSPRDPVEVWLSWSQTGGTIPGYSFPEDPVTSPGQHAPGAWWIGRVLSIQSEFAHVEVAALGNFDSTEPYMSQGLSASGIPPRLPGVPLPYRSAIVPVDALRPVWSSHTKASLDLALTGLSGINKDAQNLDKSTEGLINGEVSPLSNTSASAPRFMPPVAVSLLTPGMLHRHTILLPSHLYPIASQESSHITLVRFCGAPCLVQCETERILPSHLSGSGELHQSLPSVVGSTAATAGAWLLFHGQTGLAPAPVPVAGQFGSGPISSALMAAASFQVEVPPTSPAILLAGYPGAEGPWVRLHIWSGSSEAVRRASILESVHVSALLARHYWLSRKESTRKGELDHLPSLPDPSCLMHQTGLPTNGLTRCQSGPQVVCEDEAGYHLGPCGIEEWPGIGFETQPAGSTTKPSTTDETGNADCSGADGLAHSSTTASQVPTLPMQIVPIHIPVLEPPNQQIPSAGVNAAVTSGRSAVIGAPSPSQQHMIGYAAQFRVQPDLIGLVIGTQGANVSQARQLPGVRQISILQHGFIQIEAETVEACHEVRKLLDFVEVEVPISQRIVSRLLGLRSNNPLRQLGESAGVRQAYVLFPADRAERRRTWLEHRRNCADFQRPMGLASSNESDEPQTDSPGTGVDTEVPAAQNDQENLAPRGKHTSPTVFSRSSSAKQPGSRHFTEKDNESPLPHSIFLLGTRTAVERMRLLLEFQADSWTELEELEQERNRLQCQLPYQNYAAQGAYHSNKQYGPSHPPSGAQSGQRGRAYPGQAGGQNSQAPSGGGGRRSNASQQQQQPPPHYSGQAQGHYYGGRALPAGGGSSGVDGFAAQDTRGGGGGPRERRSGQAGGHSRGDTRGEGLAENESVQAPHQTKSGHSNSSEFSEHANWSSAGSAPAPAHPGSHGQGRGRGGGGGSYRGGSRFGQPSGAVSSGNNEAVRPQHQANGVASVHQ